MSETSVEDLAEEVARLLEQRLRLKGRGLGAKLARGGRLLPRKLRREAAYLAEAERLARVPKLRMQLDLERSRRAHADLLAYLKPLGAKERWLRLAFDILTGVALSLFVIGCVLVVIFAFRAG